MRNDTLGFFWEDKPIGRGSAALRVMPEIPETGWKPPTSFPNLAGASCISIDTETYDPELLDHGPGWARGKGHIVGVSVGVPEGHAWYFPMKHEIRKEENMAPEHVMAWLRDTLADASQPKIGANLIYDVGWLQHEGIHVAGELVDIQFAEALLDERAGVSLEEMSQKYLQVGKETSALYEWCRDYYTGPLNRQRANIYRAPPCLVGPYAEADARLPIRCANAVYPLLLKEGLYDLFRMECDLIRLLVAMRFRGVRVDLARAEQLYDTLGKRIEAEQALLNSMAGTAVDINRSATLVKAFDKLGIGYPRTAKGAPSFKKDFLEGLEHPIGNHIREIRKMTKLRGTFLKSYILESHVNGRVYCQFHPLRGDEGGTRSGRYSSSTPNLQNIPSRDEELAPLVRGIFVPDEGDTQWRRFDYSQIEYRFLAHFAQGRGSDEVRARYRDDPTTDYHEMVRQLVHMKTGIMLARKPTKTVNFGLLYGMGRAKLTRSLNLAQKEADALFEAYHAGAPFVHATFDACAKEAAQTGIITTVLGRRSRFDLWESAQSTKAGSLALPFDKAVRVYPQVKRAYTHKALNRRLQGSAADLMKMATWKALKMGLFERTGYPGITVHDELDFSDSGTREADEAFAELTHIMETAIPLSIPVKVDSEVGPDWGHAK